MTPDNTYYEGTFTGNSEVNGKGQMVMSNGDSIVGSFDGNWNDGVKVSGVYRKKPHPEVVYLCTLCLHSVRLRSVCLRSQRLRSARLLYVLYV